MGGARTGFIVILGRLQNPRTAQAFVDYMQHHGVSIEIKPHNTQLQLHVTYAKDEPKAQKAWFEFLQDPGNPRYLIASWHHNNPHIKFQSSQASTNIISTIKKHAGHATLSIMLLCSFIFMLMQFGLKIETFTALCFFTSLEATQLQELWRWLTPSLMHFSLIHIAFNLIWWWKLGGILEKNLGTMSIIGIFIFSSIIANLSQYLLVGPLFGGLSGVVYALFGYFFIAQFTFKHQEIKLPSSFYVVAMVGLMLGFFDILGLKQANGGHLGGLLCGVIQAYIDKRKIISASRN